MSKTALDVSLIKIFQRIASH